MKVLPRSWTRRGFLQAVGLGSVAVGLPPLLLPARASLGSPNDDGTPLLVVCHMNGGWDQLLALDPRSETDYGPGGSVVPAYGVVADASADPRWTASAQSFQDFLLSNPSGVLQTGGLTLGPAARPLEVHAGDLCIVRGINMGTLTHDVGIRYNLTGKFPRGLAANGSALPTWMVDQVGQQIDPTSLPPIPNLVVGPETYNDGLSSFASGLQVSSSEDLRGVLHSFPPAADPTIAEHVSTFLDRQQCASDLYDGDGMVSMFQSSRGPARILGGGELDAYFNFSDLSSPGIDDGMAELYAAFGVETLTGASLTQALAGPLGQGMIAAQALSRGLSQVVSIRLANGIDHHDEDYAVEHYPALYEGFDALNRLISFLKAQGLWDRTTILVTSEFARTPKLNARGGRDHHLSNSCLVAGNGIAGGQVVGSTDNDEFMLETIDPETGALADEDSGGIAMRPTDIHATLLSAMGLPYDHLSNQSPTVIEKILS